MQRPVGRHMASKGKREPKPQARPRALVDLNLWEVLLGLMEPAEPPETPGHDPKSNGAGPAAAGGAARAETGERVGATARKVGRGSRRERRRGSGSDFEG
jgi:hypothetical protein